MFCSVIVLLLLRHTFFLSLDLILIVSIFLYLQCVITGTLVQQSMTLFFSDSSQKTHIYIYIYIISRGCITEIHVQISLLMSLYRCERQVRPSSLQEEQTCLPIQGLHPLNGVFAERLCHSSVTKVVPFRQLLQTDEALI